jgi:hypothetical protein
LAKLPEEEKTEAGGYGKVIESCTSDARIAAMNWQTECGMTFRLIRKCTVGHLDKKQIGEVHKERSC